MTLPIVLGSLSLLALVAAFYRDLAKANRANKREWKVTIVTGLAVLICNAGAEIAKRVAETHRNADEMADRAIFQTLNAQLLMANREAGEAFVALEEAIRRLPSPTVRQLRQKASTIRDELILLTRQGSEGPRDLADATRMSEATEKLRREIEALRAEAVGEPARPTVPPPTDGDSPGHAPRVDDPAGPSTSLESVLPDGANSAKPATDESVPRRPPPGSSPSATNPIFTPDRVPAVAQVSMCDPGLAPQSGVLGYQMRGTTHCEGLYRSSVGSDTLQLVSLMRSEQSASSKSHELFWPILSTDSPVSIRAIVLEEHLPYRMDTVQRSSHFSWSANILNQLKVSPAGIGVTATVAGTLDGTKERVYLPVTIGRSDQIPSRGYTLRLSSAVDFADVTLSISQVYGRDQKAPVLRTLQHGRYYRGRPLNFAFDLSENKAGLYCVTISGRREGDITLSTAFYMHHAHESPSPTAATPSLLRQIGR